MSAPSAVAVRHALPRGAATLLLLLAAAVAPASRAAELVLSMTPSALALPVEVAAAQGFFAAEGVQIRLSECTSGPRCLQRLFDRSADLVCATELPVVFSSFQRADYAVVATFASSSSNIKIITRRSAGARGPASLAGKRVGVIPGSSSHYFLDTFLLFSGVDPKRVEIVPLQPETIVAAFQRGEIDAFAGYLRHVVPAARAVGDDVVTFSDTRIYTESYNLIATRPLLASRPDDVVKVLRALQRAERFIAEQPAQAKEIMLRRTELRRAEVDQLFPDFTYRLSLGHSLVSTMEGVARWAVREGHVPPAHVPPAPVPNYLSFVDPAPLRQVLPDAVAR
jgi:NitT/TauT family transport system substrate-binding protein